MAKIGESKQARARKQKQAAMVETSESKQVKTSKIKMMMTKRQWWKWRWNMWWNTKSRWVQGASSRGKQASKELALWKEEGTQEKKKSTPSIQNYKAPKQQKNKKPTFKRAFKKA